MRSLSVFALCCGVFIPPLTLLADTVVLSNGDVLTGKVASQSDSQVVFDHPALGKVTLERAQITSLAVQADQGAVQDEKTEEHQGTAPSPVHEELPAATGLFDTSLLEGWTRHFELGLNGSEGNTRNLNLRAAASAKYEDEHDRMAIDLSYFRTSADGQTTRNEFIGQATHDWLIPDSPWFAFAKGTYTHDQFKDWKDRVGAFGGVGYQFVDNDRWKLLGRIGAGANYEFGNVNELTPEGLVGLETAYKINDTQSVEAATTFYPSLDHVGEFRNVSSLAWSIKLNESKNMALKLGLENEYESDPAPGDKRNDLKYFATIGFDF